MTSLTFANETEAILSALGKSKNVHLSGLKGSAPTLLLSRLIQHHKGALIVISDDFQKSRELCRDVKAYLEILPPRQTTPELLTLPPLPRLAYRRTLRSGRIERERIATLARIRKLKNFICFTTIAAYCERMPDPGSFFSRFFRLEWGLNIDREKLFQKLERAGYTRVPVVDEPGDYSVRGGVIDIFSPLQEEPIRLDFFGDEIESIRPFAPLTQLSRKKELEVVEIGPAREVLPPADLDPARQCLRRRFIELNDSEIALTPALNEIEQSPNRPGFEGLLPAFSDNWHSLVNFFPEKSLPIFIEPETLKEQIEDLQQQLTEGYERSIAEKKLSFAPDSYLLPFTGALGQKKECGAIFIEATDFRPPPVAPDANDSHRESLVFQTRDNLFIRDSIRQAVHGSEHEGPLSAAADLLKEYLKLNYRIFLAGRNQTTCERLAGLLSDYGLPVTRDTTEENRKLNAILLLTTRLSRGTLLPAEKKLFLSDRDLFGGKPRNRLSEASRRKDQESFFDDFAEIKPGDLITHIEHGIGRYKGLKTFTVEGITNEYLILEYQSDDLLYVPVDSFNQLHKYHGSGDRATSLSRLGGPQWAAAKAKTRKAIDDLLIELLDLYAEREVIKSSACIEPDHMFREFEAAFTYDETPDQQRAINEVISDLNDAKPMDRLVSGDVGFGKTEVAMRAVFLTVLSGRQAAVMVPTTILAQQHFSTFTERFANYPVKIAVLSRFRTPTQQKETAAGLRQGSIDIVIGTHRLLQKDISFKNLGLLVLDEEHKFGVRHKEKLKNFRRKLDVLSMSATPIPRTLQFSLSGMRSLSAITTAPRDRLAIRTFVAAYDDTIIQEAITKELDRGGQVFFVHNSVATIEARAARLQALLPQLKIGIGHGQMRESDLEKVMLDFAEHKYDLLLCTTIIESGLDIPNANTMIVENAQNFGLAQLYQMRGRIGRSQRKAYAYLLVPELERLSHDAGKRLNALAEANTLGAGFRIAMQDLEIRGAGNILGKKQSGQISAVGYELYQEMLNDAIAEARGGKTLSKTIDPEVKIKLSAHIPPTYLPDLTLRLQFYKKIAAAENDLELARLEDELSDRCGVPPEEVLNLLRLKNLKLLLKRYHILALDAGRKKISLHLDPEHPPVAEKLMPLLQQETKLYRLTQEHWLNIEAAVAADELYSWCEKLLQKIY